MKKRKAKAECEGGSQLCSRQGVRRVSVNGSQKEGVTFLMCLACRAYHGRVAKITDAT